MNIGGSEFVIIAALALLLFGPSLIAFWFGFVLGQRKSEQSAEKPLEQPERPPEEHAEVPAGVTAAAPDSDTPSPNVSAEESSSDD